MIKLVFIIFTFTFMYTLSGCVESKQRTLVVTDYIPAKQVAIPNFDELQQSAEHGNAVAQYELGKLYADGLGVSKNHKTAMMWWEKSALQGYAPAQYSLGWMYFYGQRIMTDYVKGCFWMQSAGEQGIHEAITMYNHYCVNIQ